MIKKDKIYRVCVNNNVFTNINTQYIFFFYLSIQFHSNRINYSLFFLRYARVLTTNLSTTNNT